MKQKSKNRPSTDSAELQRVKAQNESLSDTLRSALEALGEVRQVTAKSRSKDGKEAHRIASEFLLVKRNIA